MFNHILVALDGSDFAERALAPALELAERFGGEVILMRVVAADRATAGLAPVGAYPNFSDGEPLLNEEREATDYLEEMRARWRKTGISIRARVLAGAPAESMVSVARDEEADLIVMSTHGRSGVGRLVYGSVAEAVVRGAQVPVLLIPVRRLQVGAKLTAAKSQGAARMPTAA